jgi:hypothetical protein
MTVLTEGRHAGEFILSEANGQRSRETITIASGQDLPAGAILELSGGKGISYEGSSSSEAVGVLLDAVDASGGDVTGAVYIARDAEVNGAKLSIASDNTAQDGLAAGKTGLELIGIIVR